MVDGEYYRTNVDGFSFYAVLEGEEPAGPQPLLDMDCQTCARSPATCEAELNACRDDSQCDTCAMVSGQNCPEVGTNPLLDALLACACTACSAECSEAPCVDADPG